MTKIVKLTRPGAPQAPAPIAKPNLIAALLSGPHRGVIVERLVDVGRSLGSRQCRLDFWLATVERYETRCRQEGADRAQIRAAIKLLTADVRFEFERRSEIARRLAEMEPPIEWNDVPIPSENVVVKFPGEEPATLEDGLGASFCK